MDNIADTKQIFLQQLQRCMKNLKENLIEQVYSIIKIKGLDIQIERLFLPNYEYEFPLNITSHKGASGIQTKYEKLPRSFMNFTLNMRYIFYVIDPNSNVHPLSRKKQRCCIIQIKLSGSDQRRDRVQRIMMFGSYWFSNLFLLFSH